MPPRHPCPHCPDYFVTNQVLQTHIHFVHNNGAFQPPRPKPLVWMPLLDIARGEEVFIQATSAATVAPASRIDNAQPGNASTSAVAANKRGGHGEYLSSQRRKQVLEDAAGAWAQPVLNSLSTSVRSSGRPWEIDPLRFRQKEMPINEASNPSRTPRLGFNRQPLMSVTNSTDTSMVVRQETRRVELPTSKFERQRRRSASPDRSGIPMNPPAYKFFVIFESLEAEIQQRLEVPTSTPWPSFIALLQGASAPVAGEYIPGRKTGFTLEDGPWKYALVNREFIREDRWRVLTSNLLYQAMISELMIHSATWRHVLVCHVSLAARQRGDRMYE